MVNNPIDVIFWFRVKPDKLELYKQAIDFILPITEAKESYALSTKFIKMPKASTHSMSASRTKPRFIAIWKSPWTVRSNGPKPPRLSR